MKQKIMTVLLGIICIEAVVVGAITFARPNIAQSMNKPKNEDVMLDSQYVTTNTIDETQVIHKNKQTPDTSDWLSADEEISFPIIAYTKIKKSKETSANSSVPVDEFAEQMSWLKKNDYYSLTPQEAYLVLTTNKKPAEKIVWVTFDGAYLSNYRNAFPILKKENIQATINYSVNQQGDVVYMTTHDAQDMLVSGEVNIGSYTTSNSTTVSNSAIENEPNSTTIEQEKKELDTLLNQQTTVLAYPEGDYNQTMIDNTQEAGYKLGLTTNEGYASKSNGLYLLNRIPMYSGLSENDFAYIMEVKY